jgi:hypothetical protein
LICKREFKVLLAGCPWNCIFVNLQNATTGPFCFHNLNLQI